MKQITDPNVIRQFVPQPQAIEMKRIMFNEVCVAGWEIEHKNNNNVKVLKSFEAPFDNNWNASQEKGISFSTGHCRAPMLQQALDWFDNNSEWQGFVIGSIKENHFDWEIRVDGDIKYECNQYYNSRYEAYVACIKTLIELYKNHVGVPEWNHDDY